MDIDYIVTYILILSQSRQTFEKQVFQWLMCINIQPSEYFNNLELIVDKIVRCKMGQNMRK